MKTISRLGLFAVSLMLVACMPATNTDAQLEKIIADTDMPEDVREAMLFQIRRGAETGNDGPLLPLEPRALADLTVENEREEKYVHAVAFGNWSVKCWYTKSRKSAQRLAMCDVVPWVGGGGIGEAPIPSAIGGTVQLAGTREPQLTLKSPVRQTGSQWSFDCGSKRYEEVSERSRDARLIGDEAAPFLQAMKTRDCVVTYTPKGKAEIQVTLVKHGFQEAYTYAQRYVRSPKMG